MYIPRGDGVIVECECSDWKIFESKQQHANHHQAWNEGMKLPPSLWPEMDRDGVQVVTMRSPHPQRAFMHRFSKVMQRECGHDGAPWPSYRAIYHGRDPDNWMAVVLFYDRRAFAFAITLDKANWTLWDFTTSSGTYNQGGQRRLALGWLWVCRSKRRFGHATTLVDIICRARQVPSHELAFMLPLSDAGRVFARRYEKDGKIYLA